MSRAPFPRRHTLTASALTSLAWLAIAAEARAETLDEVLATAYNSNPSLMSARASVRGTDEQLPLALSGWRPTVSVSGAAGRGQYFNNFSPLIPYTTQRSVMDYTVVVTQPLYSGGRTVAQTAQAEGAIQADRAQLEVTENQVLLSAATAFLDVARDSAIVKLNINNEQVLTKDLEMARKRFQEGELTRTDVAQAEARLAQANAERKAAEGNLQASRAAFVAIIGRPPETPVPPVSLPTVPDSLEATKTTARDNNPAVKAADWQARAAHEAIDAVQGELLPTVALQGTYGRNVNEFLEGAETRTATGMLTVSMPLYEGGATYARVRAQKQQWGQRLVEIEKAKRDAIQAATQSWENAASAHARVISYTSQIAANELALTGVKEEAKVGSRTVIEVLNAELELFTARVNEVVARHDELVASYQIRSAIGQMKAKDLTLPVDIYDPSTHYNDVRSRWIGTAE